MPDVLKTQLFSGDLFKIPPPSTVLLKIEVTSTNSLWPAALRTGNELQAWIVEGERVMNNCTLLNTGIPIDLKKCCDIWYFLTSKEFIWTNWTIKNCIHQRFVAIQTVPSTWLVHQRYSVLYHKTSNKRLANEMNMQTTSSKEENVTGCTLLHVYHKQLSMIWIYTPYIKLERWRDRAKMEVYYIPGI